MIKRSNKEILLLTATAIISILVLFFACYRFIQNDIIIAQLDLMVSFSLGGISLYLYKTRNLQITSKLLAITIIFGSFISIYINGYSQVYWAYPSILGIFYIFSPKLSVILSSLLIIAIAVILFAESSIITLSTMIVTLIIITVFTFIFAEKRQKQHNILSENEKRNILRNKTLELSVKSTKLSEILNLIVTNVEDGYPNMLCSILILDSSKKHLTLGAAPSFPSFYNDAIEGIEIGDGVGVSASTRKRVIAEDLSTHPSWAAWTELTQKAQLGSCWSEPILNIKGEVIGVFAIYHEKPSKPSQQALISIEAFSQIASIAIERDKTNLIIWEQANFDKLTGLANVHMLQKHLSHATNPSQANTKKIAFILIDIDNFKEVNDTYNHAIGDEFLIEVARRIKEKIRPQDMLFRLSADEFGVVMENLEDCYQSEKIIEKTLTSLSIPYQLNNEAIHSSASIGISIFPDDAQNKDYLLKNAEQAMFAAKKQGRNRFNYFIPAAHQKAVKRMQLIKDLHVAVAEQQFFAVYQPIINLQNNKIDKAEVLIRWQHPIHGLINPVDFISIAEETGLIIEISNWLFQQVQIDIKPWREEINSNFQVSINTSPVQYDIENGNIKQWLAQLQQANIDGSAFSFEITENLLMEHKDEVSSILQEIEKQGVAISIDDFGTGYSSFGYLKKFNTDFLKIDRSFVNQISLDNDDMAICEAIIVMAKKLGILVVAEGIETAEQKELLIKMDCEYGQGFLFSKPIIATEFEQFLIAHNHCSSAQQVT